jgi:hypothetical protein
MDDFVFYVNKEYYLVVCKIFKKLSSSNLGKSKTNIFGLQMSKKLGLNYREKLALHYIILVLEI